MVLDVCGDADDGADVRDGVPAARAPLAAAELWRDGGMVGGM
jgi:hypothetical protein